MTDISSSLMHKIWHRSEGRNFIAVVSGRGSVGKSWISVSLAELFAEQEQNVLLFDGDLGLANLDVQLGLTSSLDIGSVLNGKLPMNKIIRHFDRGGFDVITGRSAEMTLGSLDKSMLQVLTDDLLLLGTHYDTVLLDLNGGLSDIWYAFAKISKKILVVCHDEETALIDAYALIKKIAEAGLQKNVQIVISGAKSLKEGERTYYTLVKACDFLGDFEPPLCGIVRYNEGMTDYLRYQMSPLNGYAACDAVKDIKNILKNLKNK